MSTDLVPLGPRRAEFIAVFNRLCVSLQTPVDETGATPEIYLDALGDLPMPALERGAAALMRERGRRYFPSVVEWREKADLEIERMQQESLRRSTHQGEGYFCPHCQDTGFEACRCSGDGGCKMKSHHSCARQGEPHDYRTICTCREHNPEYQRRRPTCTGQSKASRGER